MGLKKFGPKLYIKVIGDNLCLMKLGPLFSQNEAQNRMILNQRATSSRVAKAAAT